MLALLALASVLAVAQETPAGPTFDTVRAPNPHFTADELDADFRRSERTPGRALTPAEVWTIKSYTGESYRVINAGLRDGSAYSGALLAEVCALDRALAKAAIGREGFLLYRGHSWLPPGSDQVGFEVVDRAYLSTTLLETIAQKFAGWGGGPKVVDVLWFPAGPPPGAWIDLLSLYKERDELEGTLNVMREYEVLLARGLRFRVADVRLRSVFFSTYVYRLLVYAGPAAPDPRDPGCP